MKKTAETKCSFYEKIERRNANLDFAVLCYSFEKEKSNDLPDQLSLRVILGFIFFFVFFVLGISYFVYRFPKFGFIYRCWRLERTTVEMSKLNKDLVFLILQFLNEEGFTESAHMYISLSLSLSGPLNLIISDLIIHLVDYA